MPEVSVGCHGCGQVSEFESAVGRSEECAGCGADLRVCLNCVFYDVSAYNDCSEPSAERVLDKDKANFCDFFRPAGGSAPTASSRGSGESAQSELEKLFGKK